MGVRHQCMWCGANGPIKYKFKHALFVIYKN